MISYLRVILDPDAEQAKGGICGPGSNVSKKKYFRFHFLEFFGDRFQYQYGITDNGGAFLI